ncbi:hypothetical protein QR680_012111 [Steinernema hermaphroditum]|uniref:F-box domain-containing protein n=1 Tax=Steinernema hermaphroditum TaxID=289476 RepID=A0AA39I0Z2_9BILA|nr:hypothetical protein QR680_012111 [Steinernema hermaphroditum]
MEKVPIEFIELVTHHLSYETVKELHVAYADYYAWRLITEKELDRRFEVTITIGLREDLPGKILMGAQKKLLKTKNCMKWDGGDRRFGRLREICIGLDWNPSNHNDAFYRCFFTFLDVHPDELFRMLDLPVDPMGTTLYIDDRPRFAIPKYITFDRVLAMANIQNLPKTLKKVILRVCPVASAALAVQIMKHLEGSPTLSSLQIISSNRHPDPTILFALVELMAEKRHHNFSAVIEATAFSESTIANFVEKWRQTQDGYCGSATEVVLVGNYAACKLPGDLTFKSEAMRRHCVRHKPMTSVMILEVPNSGNLDISIIPFNDDSTMNSKGLGIELSSPKCSSM